MKRKYKKRNTYHSVKKYKYIKRSHKHYFLKEKLKDIPAILVTIVIVFGGIYCCDIVLQEVTGYRIGGVEEGTRIIYAGLGLLTQKMVFLENPTFDEMCKFIENDKTNLNHYSYSYVCEDFSKDVIRNAKMQGIKIGYVEIETADSYGHGIVAFNTIDKGVYFVEPQLDVVFSAEQMNEMINKGYYSIGRDYGSFYEYFDFVPIRYTIDWSIIG